METVRSLVLSRSRSFDNLVNFPGFNVSAGRRSARALQAVVRRIAIDSSAALCVAPLMLVCGPHVMDINSWKP
jgi:hypothetical protein